MTHQGFLDPKGYVICRQFFDEKEMTFLEDALKAARPRFPTTLNKGGLEFREFLHFHSKPLQTFLSSEKIVNLLKPYIGDDFWLRKDQLVTKYPGGHEFPWHQDNAYNKLNEEYYQLWIALTEMSPENGGLRLLAGTHQAGLLPHHQVDNHLCWTGTPKDEVIVRASRGDVVLFSSMLLHRSGPNHTQKNRVAYVAEYMPSSHYDFYARPPYFQIARRGRSVPKFVYFNKGSLSPSNRLRYAIPEIRWRRWRIEERLRKKAKQLLGKP